MKKNKITEFESMINSLNPEEQILIDTNHYFYLYSKAFDYVHGGGPDVYRENDFFNQPITTDKEEQELLYAGCQQVLLGKGLINENPFIGIDVHGFSLLLSLFHFESINRKTFYRFVLNGEKGILDYITFQHAISGNQVSLFNYCEYEKNNF